MKYVLLGIMISLQVVSMAYCQDQRPEQAAELNEQISQDSDFQKKDIIVLSEFTDKTYKEMLEVLGAPIDKTGYSIEQAPTKSWNHAELFSKYPKSSKDVQIMEVTWDAGDFSILACFHMVNGENRCLVAKKIRKGIKF